jgi:hypothetical protein
MISEHLANFFVREPFVGVSLNLSDGRSVPMLHPEFVSIAHGGLAVCYFHRTGQIELIDPSHIVSILTMQPADLNLFIR